jgi:endonuclease YncB( thermonuclease family)
MGTRAPRLVVLLVFAIAACGSASAPAPIAAPTAEPILVTPGPIATAAAPTEAAFPQSGPTGKTETATVVKITDGDTIRVDRGHGSEPLRYIGMNAPEPNQPGGAEATAANAALVSLGTKVVLERDVSKVDKYGRLLRYVWLHDGDTWLLVNLQLVQDGVARAVAYPPDTKYQEALSEAQAAAKVSHLGVWGFVAAPTPAPTKKPSSGGGQNCHPSYSPCLPIVDDLDCADVRAMGKAPVVVKGPDDYRLDADHDGIGCE